MKYRCIKDTPWSKKEAIIIKAGDCWISENGCDPFIVDPQEWPGYFERIEEKSDEEKLGWLIVGLANEYFPGNSLVQANYIAKALLDKGLIDRTKL